MSKPRFKLTDFIQSELDPNLYYVIAQHPFQDFHLQVQPQVFNNMTLNREFVDRGVKCAEYRPPEWLNDWQDKIYIRFYMP